MLTHITSFCIIYEGTCYVFYIYTFSEIPDEKLDRAPDDNADIIAARDCLGNQYIFLALELGQSYELITQVTHNTNTLQDRVYQILMAWRRENPADSTPRLLLDTMTFLGLNTSTIQNKMLEK